MREIIRDYWSSKALSRVGTALAPAMGMRLVIASQLTLLMSCLVTQNASIPEENNFPPSIVTEGAAGTLGVKLVQIITVDLDSFDGPSLVIPTIVRDPNFEQVLEYQVWVDFEPPFGGTGQLTSDTDAIIEAEGVLSREFQVSVPITALEPAGRCHKVELLVSSRFAGGASFRQGIEREDIARAVWWVRVIDQDVAEVKMDTCP